MEKAEGVPLFIEEVTKTLLDLGVLERANGTYRLVKSLAEVSVPETMQDIIMARLDRLGKTASARCNSPRSSAGNSWCGSWSASLAHRPARRALAGAQDLRDYLRPGAPPRAGLYLQARCHPGCRLSQPPDTAT